MFVPVGIDTGVSTAAGDMLYVQDACCMSRLESSDIPKSMSAFCSPVSWPVLRIVIVDADVE